MKLSRNIPVLRTIMQKQYRLKSFVCIAVLIVSFASFNMTYLIVSSIYQHAFVKSADKVSDAISQQVFNSMLQLMERGWTRGELNEFLESVKGSNRQFPYKVEIYRGESVERIYGKIGQQEIGKNVQQAFQTGENITFKSGHVLINIYPIKAGDKCLKCHANTKSGDVLGVMRVQHDMGPAMDEAKEKFVVLFFILSPIPFIMAGLIANFLNTRINSSTELFHEKIKDINSIKDLTKLEVGDINLGFTEFNKILSEIRELVRKMRNVSVDKDILEFEIKILEKFIITSEVVRDWKEYVGYLLLEVNKVMEAYALFSIFHVGEVLYDLEIFWRNTPTELTKERFEKIVLRQIRDKSKKFSDITELKINHNIADLSVSLNELDERDIEFQTKSLILEIPQIGGVVGIGVQSKITDDPIRSLVIDGILTTLLNVVGSIKAISKYTKDLEYYATRDPLTNLYNQRVFWELLGYEIGRASRYEYKFSVLVIDLDNFKNINDSYGHTFGDRFLSEFALKVRETLRQGDILARYGGDEFVIVLPEADEEQAFMVAGRTKDHMERLSLSAPDGAQVRATVSIGLAVFPDHADNAKDLFMFADNMMYKAKAEGKNRIIIPTQKDIVEVFKTVSEKTFMVSNAIEERKIIPYFQPIINIKTGEIECHEVLSRMDTDEGLLNAREFIEIAERLGAISKLDLILMEKVFEKVRNEGYKGCLFINLSTKSLILSEFIPNILKLAKKYDIDHSKVVFEITERDTVKNISLLEKFVDNLKFEGFGFAIDDFGSGLSSFHYVKRFPIDYVKIDGDFIRSMVRSDKDMAIVKTMLVLAKEFNIKTIAEFVENKDILDATKALGMDYGQGYYIGTPSPELITKV